MKKGEIKIYAACLAAYNNGILHGAWIDAGRDAWALYDDIHAMLRASPMPDAEEWAIHDHEGFEGIQISELPKPLPSSPSMARADYVQDITGECTASPESLRYYIDWQAMARDAELSGDLFTIQTAHDEVHVFVGA